IAAVAACLFLLMTLLSYSSNDPAWDVSVKVHSFENAGGMIGAWLSSILLASLGYFAYLFPLLLGIRAWRIFRNRHQQWHWNGLQFVWHLPGLVCLVAAGTVLADIHFVASTVPAATRHTRPVRCHTNCRDSAGGHSLCRAGRHAG